MKNGMLNLGRDKDPRKSTRHIDKAAVSHLHDQVGDQDAAVFGVEVNEGDDDNEFAIFLAEFEGWHVCAGPAGRRVREPIFLSPDQPRPAVDVRWLEHTAVPHWSPQRSILRVRLADRPETLLAVHPAAGPHTAGDRPKRYEAALSRSWDIAHRALVEAKRVEHKAGRNVTVLADLNNYVLPGMPGEITVFHERTDYGTALAAKGFKARFRDLGEWPAGLDSHGIHVMSGTYKEEKK